MSRIQGVDKGETCGEIRRIFDRQEKVYGAPLYNHQVLARRPGIFYGFRAMWDGLEEDALLSARLRDLVNVKVASLIGCEL